MGALQSKIWSEVPSNEVPESPSETQPLSTHGKPVAPFRDPRSISDDVERTPIQLGSDKSKETARSTSIPEVNQTPTGPSFAARFKVSISCSNLDKQTLQVFACFNKQNYSDLTLQLFIF